MLSYYSYSIADTKGENQDYLNCYLDRPYFFAVIADGIAENMESGTMAKKATELFIKKLTRNRDQSLEKVFHEINEALIKIKNHQSTGTTLTAVRIIDNHLEWMHCGDSSLRIIRDSKIKKLTADHTVSADIKDFGKRLIKEPFLIRKKHILTSSLATKKKITLDAGKTILQKNDLLLIATDGFSNLLSDHSILTLIKQKESGEKLHERLINFISQAFRIDDVSYIFAKIQ